MAREHKKNFSVKHPPDTTIAPEVSAAVLSRIPEGKITCRSAFDLATEIAVSPSVIGIALDLHEGRITGCQLGLFSPMREIPPSHEKREIDGRLKADIEAALENNRLTCERAWKIADDRNLPRLEVGRACEALHIRISRCQLGAF